MLNLVEAKEVKEVVTLIREMGLVLAPFLAPALARAQAQPLPSQAPRARSPQLKNRPKSQRINCHQSMASMERALVVIQIVIRHSYRALCLIRNYLTLK